MHLTLVILTTVTLAAAAAIETVTFDQAAAGQAPAGWTATRTGSGERRSSMKTRSVNGSEPTLCTDSLDSCFITRP